MTDEERLQGLVRALIVLERAIANEKRFPPIGRKGTYKQGYMEALARIHDIPWWGAAMKEIEEIKAEHPEWDSRWFGF